MIIRKASVAAAVLQVALIVGGCSARSAERVTSFSIAPLGSGSNLLGDGGFEQPGLGVWSLTSVSGVSATTDRRIHAEGSQSLRLTAVAAAVPHSVVLEQSVSVLPSTGAGARYVLKVLVRTSQLNRRIETELKLTYAGGGYAFFRGHTRFRGRPGIPPGTSRGWLSVVVRATARFPLQAVEAFIVDTGPGNLNGTVWLDGADLRTH
jgi:hypothetical protein